MNTEYTVLYRWSNCSIGEEILKELLPGPFTLILERSTNLNPDLNPGVQSVGIRIPDSALCIKLVAQLGEPIALTSANISGKSSAISVEVCIICTIHDGLSENPTCSCNTYILELLQKCYQNTKSKITHTTKKICMPLLKEDSVEIVYSRTSII